MQNQQSNNASEEKKGEKSGEKKAGHQMNYVSRIIERKLDITCMYLVSLHPSRPHSFYNIIFIVIFFFLLSAGTRNTNRFVNDTIAPKVSPPFPSHICLYVHIIYTFYKAFQYSNKSVTKRQRSGEKTGTPSNECETENKLENRNRRGPETECNRNSRYKQKNNRSRYISTLLYLFIYLLIFFGHFVL